MSEERTPGIMPEDYIFALDIGTRTIIGLVGVQEEGRFIVHASSVIAHESRAMLDGQIHDINKVAQGARKVKEALEQELGFKLTQVSIAAAGRVLKTYQIKVEREIEEGTEIDAPLISALEMEAIQKAQFEIEKDLPHKERNKFYCVGYSVVTYYLNDYVISSLAGHKGTKIGVELLATFLPQMVVDSLYTVMERVGLEVNFLTLEPIAALNVAIPKDLRLLNLALVDIGAGTSDIAITKSGTVVAYAMVPVAGDEITETIAQHYLVDFNTAEGIKLALSNGQESIVFTDILDNQVTVSPQEVQEVIRPVIEQLARTIAEKILEYNGGKSPNAVFLVGGGSQVKNLCETMSTLLGLPKERVAVRNRSIAKNIEVANDALKGPDSITPLGIMVTTALNKGQDFYYVTVNGNKVKMYNSRKMLVSDALLLAGFNPDQLICKSGKNLKFTLNGQPKTVRGTFGKPSEIYVNGNISSLNAFIAPGDELTVIPAERGTDGFMRVSDLVKDQAPITLTFNHNTYTVPYPVLVNGVEVSHDTAVRDGDDVVVPEALPLEDIANRYEMDSLIWRFTVNGEDSGLDRLVKPGDKVQGLPKTYGVAEPVSIPGKPMVTSEAQSVVSGIGNMAGSPAAQAYEKPEAQSGAVIQQQTEHQAAQSEAALGGLSSGLATDIEALAMEVNQKRSGDGSIRVIVNGEPIDLPPKQTAYMFIDIFNHIDFDLSNPKGTIVLQLNGKDANYTDIIQTGDLIDIYWRD